MFCGWCVLSTGIILLFLITKSFGKSIQSSIENSTIGTDQYSNKTKSRILTRPNNVEFYGSEQDIVFPDKIADRVDISSRISASPQCSSSLSYCENVEGYPYDQIKRVLEQTRMYHSFFGKDEAPLEISNRLGGDDDGEFVCRSLRKTIFPRMMQTRNNEWKFVINQGKDEQSVQGILVEECKTPERACEIPGSHYLDPLYSLTCKQKYVYRRLLTFDGRGGLVSDTFKIPAACCCSFKQT